MMSICKNHFLRIFTVCILAIILIVAAYFLFFVNRTTIKGDSMEKLTELMRRDFSEAEITDIQCKYVKDNAIGEACTHLFVFLKESGELEFKEYYFDSNGGGISDPNLELIPPGDIVLLKELGIELHQIQKHGGNYNQIKVGFSTVPYTIHWYQIDESYDGKSNVVLLASIPRKIVINVDKVIQEQ